MTQKHNPLQVVQRPVVCRHLLSKGMFVTGQLDPADDAAGDVDHVGDGHCWCNQTQNVLGPDDQLVERETCLSTRACFESRV